jgi:hypothetical protein
LHQQAVMVRFVEILAMMKVRILQLTTNCSLATIVT